MTETDALLILNAVPGLGNSRIRKLMRHFGSAAAILSLNSHQLRRDHFFEGEWVDNLFNFPRDHFLKQEHHRMRDAGVGAVFDGHPGYPALLAQIPDAPVVLYVKGRIPEDVPGIGIVGSRRASIYGREISEKFSVRFAELGFMIVSGLARGIDTAAHQGCLKICGRTVAVLGCGLSRVYPPENERLMARAAEHGAVISEFPMIMGPLAYNFPRRNRIISGLSLGVIVVEAARRSGALITADFAMEQGREVFAVPGPIGSSSSQGAHDLIKNGAKLVTCLEDVLEELKIPLQEFVSKPVDESLSLIYKEDCLPDLPGDESEKKIPDDPGQGGAAERQTDGLQPQEIGILKLLGSQTRHVDQIADISGLAAGQISGILLGLEIKGLVEQMPGKYFRCVANHAPRTMHYGQNKII